MVECSDKILTVGDRKFKKLIPYETLLEYIDKLAERINGDYSEREHMPLFVGVLNGSFMFCAELMKKIDFPCEISFVKLASYHGLSSLGEVSELIGLKEDIKGRDIVIVEDIVETGGSIEKLVNTLQPLSPKSIHIATMLFKPYKYTKQIEIRYPAMEVPDDFIIGFGLDYNGLGRNLKDIYTVIDEK